MTPQLPVFSVFFWCWENNTKNGAAVTSLRSFLSRDDFSVLFFSSFPIKKWLFFISHWLAMSNGLYNPFIYALFSVRIFLFFISDTLLELIGVWSFPPYSKLSSGDFTCSFTLRILLTFLNYSRNWSNWVFKATKLWNQVPTLDHFVVQNSGDFLGWK